MANTYSSIVTTRIPHTHQIALGLTEKLSEEHLHWRPNLHAPSAGFHLWHIARWADRLQAGLPHMTAELHHRLGHAVEIWEAEGMAEKWGMGGIALGPNNTGMEMGDEMSAQMKLPEKGVLTDYARRAFAAADRSVEAVDDAQFIARGPDLYGRESAVGDTLVAHLRHVNRHIGMIEALVGVQGMRGTATV